MIEDMNEELIEHKIKSEDIKRDLSTIEVKEEFSKER